MKSERKSWLSTLFAYAESVQKRLLLSALLSVLSVMLGLAPFYCMYRMICLFAAGSATAALAVRWCLLALLAYGSRILLFSLSTGVSHTMAYHILERLRLRLADRLLHAPLGNVERHSIGEIKSVMVDKIEGIEPPLAHMIPEGAGHVVLPVVSIAALAYLDWHLALASLVTFPLSFLCMGLTFRISGDSFAQYDRSNSAMNSARCRTTAARLKAAFRHEWNLLVFWAAGHHWRRSPRLFSGENSIKRSIPAGMERLSRTDCPPALPFFYMRRWRYFLVSTSNSEQNSTPLEHF